MIRNKIELKISLILLSIVSLFFLLTNIAYSGTIVIKPGRFDHFTLQAPDKIVAGENFVMKVYVYDAHNNLITNFSEYGKEFKVDVSGSSTVQPSILNGKSFSGGIANILINSKKSENIIFSIKESGGTVPVISKDLFVAPNKLDHFELQSQSTVTAGNIFDVKIIAKDMFDNTVNDVDIGRNIKMTSTGTSSMKQVGRPTIDFKNGTGTASFVSEKVGDSVIELQEVSTGSSGKTHSIKINPASLSNFKIQAPRKVIAGEPFDLLIAAYDTYGNVVTNYAAVGGGIGLSTTGNSKIEPSSVSPSDFKNGQAIVKVVYEKAEEVQVIAKESNRNQEGRTDGILVMNTGPDHFVVITPETAMSGQRFKIKVEAYDKFNNIVSNFNLIGSDVELTTSGTGSITPARISFSDFINGVAVLDVLYDKAESFMISTRMMGEKPAGRITLKDKEVEREIVKTDGERSQKTIDREVITPKKPIAENKEEELRKDSREAKTSKAQEKVKTNKEVKKTEKPVRIAKKEVSETRQVDKKPVEPKPVKQPGEELKKPSAAVIPKVEKKPVQTKAAIKPAEPLEKPSVAERTGKEKADIYKVSKVTIIEAKDKAMLVINITNPNGHLDYADEIESKYGREWLKVSLKPAFNNTEKMFKFSSSFIGEVRIEEDKSLPNRLLLYIELLPSNLTYDIARVKNSLIVTLANPVTLLLQRSLLQERSLSSLTVQAASNRYLLSHTKGLLWIQYYRKLINYL